MPPTKLKPRNCGCSKLIGQPAAHATMSGRPMISPKLLHKAGNCCPVRSCRRFDHHASATAARAPNTKAARTYPAPTPTTGAGTMSPRLFRKIASRIERLWRGPGSVPRTARYQNRIWKQERQVADELHVSARQARKQPVGGQSCNADHKAEHGRKHDAETGHEKRVEQPHEKHAAVCIGFAIGNERLIDAESGSIVEKAEAAGDSLGCQIGSGVERKLVTEPQQQR